MFVILDFNGLVWMGQMGAPALLASVYTEVPAGLLRERSWGPEDPETLLPRPPRDASKEGRCPLGCINGKRNSWGLSQIYIPSQACVRVGFHGAQTEVASSINDAEVTGFP